MTPLIDQFPEGRLSLDEEGRLASLGKAGDQDAANKLVMATMREALLYTQRTCRGTIDDPVRVSLCYRKLMMCVNRFDPARKIRFFAFSKAALRGEMKSHWERQDVVRNASEIVSADSLDGWRGMRNAPHRPYYMQKDLKQSPGNLVGVDDDKEESVRERVTGEIEAPDMEQICVRDRWTEIKRLVWGKLSSRHRMVLTLTYQSGLNFPEIGRMMDLTRSMIHAIHREAIQKIRDEIAKDGRLLEE